MKVILKPVIITKVRQGTQTRKSFISPFHFSHGMVHNLRVWWINIDVLDLHIILLRDSPNKNFQWFPELWTVVGGKGEMLRVGKYWILKQSEKNKCDQGFPSFYHK